MGIFKKILLLFLRYILETITGFQHSFAGLGLGVQIGPQKERKIAPVGEFRTLGHYKLNKKDELLTGIRIVFIQILSRINSS